LTHRRPLLHGFVLGLIAFGVFSSIFVSKTFPFQANDGTPVTNLSLPSLGAAPPEEPVLTSGVVMDTMSRQDLERYAAALAMPEAPTPAPTTAPTAAPTEAPRPLFVSYTVEEGDTASSIASRFGVTLQYLLWNNPELRDGDVLAVGDVVFVPTGNGILHYVRLGETLSGIATYFGVGVDEIVGFPGNGLSSPDQVVEGQLVFVPNGVPPSSVAPEPTAAPVLVAAATPPPAPAAPAQPPAAAPPPQVTSGSGMIWPFSGNISSYWGDGRGHRGIDIDGFGRDGAPIVAAAGGTVSFAGGGGNGYGLYVVIRHANGIETLYAHLGSLSVSMGQQVSQGQTLGGVGRTGNASGTHLHFEVHVGGVAVDPMGYLP
jgi:murein DD-endopeptidase MepM/ murein hydrolase activator NlpD